MSLNLIIHTNVKTLYFISGLSPKISKTCITGVKYVHLGESVEFHCIATGIDPLKYNWSGPQFITGSTEVLRISAVSRKHEGKYKCTVTNRFSTTTPATLEYILTVGKFAM